MDLGLAEQTAIVIGGAKGIGRAIGAAFAGEGCSLRLVDVDAQVEQVAGEMSAIGIQLDATDFNAVQRMADQVCQEQQGPLHVVYAAGCGSGRYGFPFWKLSPSDWARCWEVNLLGAVHTAHAFASHWVERQAGTFLLLSSIAGQIGSQTDPPYSAAKAGVINFAQCCAKDLAPYNVRVNTICPGMVQTAVNRSVWQAWHEQQPVDKQLSYDDWAGEKVKRVAPLGRWQTAEDIAALAVFLASPRAENITGQTMNVDGGQVMHW